MNLQAYIALGWTPIFANQTTNGSVIQQVAGWFGGNGSVPTTGLFVGSTGFVTNITDGVNIAGGGGGGGAAISAGANSQNTGTINFANSNGITFGLSNNGTMTASVATNYQSQGAYLTTAAQSNQVVNSFNGSTGQISLNVGSSLSSSTNGSSITLGLASNITTALQSAGAYLTTAMQSGSQSQLWIMGNSSGTIGGTNISGTIYSNGASFSVAAPGGGGNTLTVSAANGTFQSNAITFANSNGVSFSTGTQGVYATVATNYQSQGAYLTTADLSANSSKYIQNWKLSGNTAGTTSSAQGTDLWLAGGNGITLSGSSNTISFSVATNYQSQGAYLTTAAQSNQVVNSLNGSTGQISLNIGSSLSSSTNGSSITFGLASNITTALQSTGAYLTTADLSANSSNYFRNWKLTGNTSGTTSSLQGTDFWLGGGNGVTLSGSSNSISFSVATNYQSQGAYLTTAMQSGSQSQLWIMGNSSATIGGTNISGTVYSNGMSLSAAAPGGGGNTLTVSAANGTFQSNAITFANSNGVSFSTGTQGVYATVATNYQSQGAYLTTAMQSGSQSQLWVMGNSSATVGGTNISGTMYSNGLSLSAAVGGGGDGYNIIGVNGVATSLSTTMTLTNANNVSFGLNAGLITASASFPAQTQQPMYFSLSNSNTSANTMTFGNLNGVSWSFSNGSIVGSVQTNYQSTGAYLTTAMQTGSQSQLWVMGNSSATIGGSNVSGTMYSNGLSLSDQPGFSAWSLAGNNTAGTTGTSLAGDSIQYFSGGANITLSGNSNTIVINGAAPGGTTWWTGSYYKPFDLVQGTSSYSIGSNVVNVQPIMIPFPLSVSYIRMPVSFGNMTSTTVGYTAGSSSFYYYQSINAVLYSQGAGANSRSLQSFASSYAAFTEAYLFSVSNAGTNESIAYQITYPSEGFNTANSATTMLTTAAGASIYLHSTGGMTNFSGIHQLDIPFATLLNPGNYWIAINRSTNSTTSGGGIAITAQVNKAHTFIVATQINSNFVPLGYASAGGATASTQPVWAVGLGSHTVSAQGATTGSLALSSVSSVANFPIIPMQFIRQA